MLKIKDKNVTFFYFGNRNQTNDSNQKILENRLTINNQYRCKEGNKANMWGHFKRRTSFKLPLNGLQFHVGIKWDGFFQSTRSSLNGTGFNFNK